MKFWALLIVAVLLTGCKIQEEETGPPEPQGIDYLETNYADVEYLEVRLPSGQTLRCVVMSDPQGNGGLSCDWQGAAIS